MQYKSSIFNHKLEDKNGQTYIYNAHSGSLIKVSVDYLTFLDGLNGNKNPEESVYFENSVRSGFIVNEKCNEFGLIKRRTNALMYSLQQESVTYTIAVTTACNYKCSYCFEGNITTAKQMDVEIQQQVIKFIKQDIGKNKSLKKLVITWFGGEPLCNVAAIENISNELVALCKERGIHYVASIITNGRLLSIRNLELLKKCKIGSIQVTLDGQKDAYMKYKGATAVDFDEVMHTLRVLKNEEFSVNLRLNCDRNNIDSIHRLIDDLYIDGLLEQFYTYLAPIATRTNSDLSPEEMLEERIGFLKRLKEYGYSDKIIQYLPKPRYLSCGLLKTGSYVIDVDGTIKKCERYVGDDTQVVGDVFVGEYYNVSGEKFCENDISEYCECCNIFPICRGGCKKFRMEGNAMDCSIQKLELLKTLEIIIS